MYLTQRQQTPLSRKMFICFEHEISFKPVRKKHVYANWIVTVPSATLITSAIFHRHSTSTDKVTATITVYSRLTIKVYQGHQTVLPRFPTTIYYIGVIIPRQLR